MRIIDQLRSVQHVFAANRARTVLTLLGIMIGSGSIVLLAGLLRGGEEALLESGQRANESDMITVRRDEPPARQQKKTRRTLSHPDADLLADSPLLDGVSVASEQTRDGRAVFHDKKKRVRLVAAAPIALPLNRLKLAQGRFLVDEDLSARRRVCVVGYDVWMELLQSRDSVDGVTINILGIDWAVVGVLARKPPLGGGGDGLWMWDRKVVVPQTTFDAVFDPSHQANRLYVRLRGLAELATRAGAVQRVVQQTLLRRHLGVQNFKVEGDDGAANQMHLILDIIKMLLLGTGLLSLLVGGINIMNIMLVTVTERTREIGIRRAIGAPPSSILLQFLLEAGFIASTGGVIGVCGGMLASWLAALGLSQLVGQWALHIENWSVVLGLSLSLATGVLFGLFPAWRASRLDPVEALRYE